MRSSTREAIKTLLRLDRSVTPDERKSVLIAISTARTGSVADGLVTLAQAAMHMNIDRTTLWRKVKRGEIVSVKRGNRNYVKLPVEATDNTPLFTQSK